MPSLLTSVLTVAVGRNSTALYRTARCTAAAMGGPALTDKTPKWRIYDCRGTTVGVRLQEYRSPQMSCQQRMRPETARMCENGKTGRARHGLAASLHPDLQKCIINELSGVSGS
jgi:hypothetical protein